MPNEQQSSHPSDVATAARIARLLDDRYIEPLIGLLVPGLGDLVGSTLGLYVVSIAVRRKLAPVTIARMLLNLAFDAVLGSIPLLGDVGDFFFKAHRKNLQLLEARAGTTPRASASDWIFVALAAVVLLACLTAPVVLLVLFLRWVF